MEHEGDSDTKGIRRVGNERKNRDKTDWRIVEIGKNTQKRAEVIWRHLVSNKNHHFKLVWYTGKDWNNNNNHNNYNNQQKKKRTCKIVDFVSRQTTE